MFYTTIYTTLLQPLLQFSKKFNHYGSECSWHSGVAVTVVQVEGLHGMFTLGTMN